VLLIVVVSALLIFGCYALWNNVLNYTRTTSSGARQAAETVAAATQTAALPPTFDCLPTFPPTWTPPPPCEDFVVTVESAVVRECPDEGCKIIDAYRSGDVVCVIGHPADAPQWYQVERDREYRSLELGYMHRNIISPLNPTPTPTITLTPTETHTPAPTNTLPSTRTPAPTYTPTPTDTPDPNAPTPFPTPESVAV
jgi:hypothetical protein